MAWNPEANDVFLKALETPSREERAAYLDQRCGDNAELRAQVLSLLEASERAGSFLESPAPALVATIDEQPVAERPGTVIGPYKLLQQIGEGGMGTVFMAEQTQPVQRKVALKVIKPGMDSGQVIARFEAERQALALMDHVNIARVFDGGTTNSGRPYFVMELVHGVPITKYCDDNHLTPRERLELFVPVCQAIQHAHQKGIIHRDIKPSNVMVTLYDGKPVPKVIDFGVAKATEQKLTERTLFTQYGTIVGTLEYMSPEQAEMSALGVDTRSDIYSLGVLLYELLTGSTPLERPRLREAAYAEVLRLIREEEAPKPSARLSSSDTLPAIAAARKTEPAKLARLMRGELDWIVMKCLEKDRNRRYDTANSLARDIERYFHDEPVQACPPSAAYRLRKFVRRNRTAVAAVVSAIGLLLLAVLGLTLSNMRIAQEQKLTEVQRDEAEANFRTARQAVDEQFTLVSQSKLFEVPGFQSLRKELLESALKYYLDFLRQRPDDPELQAEVAAAHLRLYQIHEAIDGSYSPDAMGELEKGIEILEKLLRQHTDDAGLCNHLAGFAKGGRSLHAGYSAGGPTAAPVVLISLFQRAVRIWENFVQDNPTEIGFQIDLSAFYGALQEIQASAGQPAEALDSVRKVLAIRKKIARENPNVPEYRAELAHTHEALGRRLRQAGPPDEVENHFRRAHELRQKLADECPEVPEYRAVLAGSHHSLGSWLADTDRPQQAEQAYSKALIEQENLVTKFPNMPGYRGGLASYHDSLGHLFRVTGRADKAEQAYRQALENWDKLAAEFPANANYRVPFTSFNLCLLLAASGQLQEAEKVYRKVLEFRPETPDACNYMAWRLAACPDPRFGDRNRALELAKKAVALAPDAGYYWNTLGVAHYRKGNWRDAVVALEKSMQHGNGGDSFDRFFLAMAHWQLGDKEQARKWYDLAVQWMEKNEQHSMAEELRQELPRFRGEAAELLGIKDQPTAKEKEKPHAKAPSR